MATCIHCGHVTRTTTRAPRAHSDLPERAALDAAFAAKELTQAAYFDACKRIARRDDLRFLIRVAGARMPIALLSEASLLLIQLETRKATAADVAAINSLRDRYRMSKGSLVVRASRRKVAA
jgi:hypothetical protein